ncbi:membrane protein [Staphylococcus phage Stab23]|nr:membrane protein [Staphylococcus phage Stab23]
MVFVHSKFSSKNVFVLYVIYAIIGIGTYVVLTMFQTTSVLIKNDVIDTIENTEHYIGFNDPITILTISFIGAILGGIWYKMKKIIKKSNFKNKKRR